MATNPQPSTTEQAQAEAPVEPIELTPTDGSGFTGESVQVAGGAGAIRPLLKWLKGKSGKTGEAAEEAGEEATQQGTAAAVGTEIGPATRQSSPDGDILGPEMRPLTGSTRQVPNPEYYTSPDAVRLLNYVHSKAERIASQSHAETAARAREKGVFKQTGTDAAAIMRPEELQALRNVTQKLGGDIARRSVKIRQQKLNGLEPSNQELAELEMMTRQFMVGHTTVTKTLSDAARLLNSAQIKASSQDAMVREMAETLANSGGRDVLIEKAEIIGKAASEAEDAAEFASKLGEIAEQSWAARTWDQIMRVRYNLMLSSMRTHGANVLGSLAYGATEGVQIPVVFAINQVGRGRRRLLGKDYSLPGDMTVESMGSELRGVVEGVKSGFTLGWRIAKGEVIPSASEAGKFITESGLRYKHLGAPPGTAAAQLAQPSGGQAALETAGKVLDTPTRMLEAEDAFFRSVAYEQRLYGLAHRQATIDAGGDADAFTEAYQSYLRDPPPEMREEALEYGRKITFTNHPSIYGKLFGVLGDAGARVQDFGPGRLIVPFVRTPVNLLGASLQYTGAQQALAPMTTLRQLRSGNPRESAEAASRLTVALGIYLALHDYVAEGNVTGVGSANRQHVRLLEQTGWRQNAIRLDDTYYELNRLDPIGLTLATVATLHELEQESNHSDEDKMGAAAGALMQLAELQLDRSYLSSLGDLVAAVNLGEGGGKGVAALATSTLTSMVVPNVARDVREMADPFSRAQVFDPKQQGFAEAAANRQRMNILNALPLGSERLPVRLDWEGKPMLNAGHYLVRGLIPIRRGEVNQVSDGSLELLRNRVYPSYSRPSMAVPNGQGVFTVPLLSLDDGRGHIFSYYQQLVGRHRSEQVERIIDSSAYRRAVEEGRTGNPESVTGELLARALRRGQQLAKMEMLEKLDEGAEVVLYPDSGAEVRIELPQIDMRVQRRFLQDYARATEEEREEMQEDVPEGLHFRRRSAAPAVKHIEEIRF